MKAFKKKISVVLITACCLFGYSFAQTLRYPISMPYISMSAYSKQQADVFSFTGNQAALAGIKNPGIGVYGERRFLLAEISDYRIAAAFPSKYGNFGIQVNYAGFINFNEYKTGLAYARGLGTKVDVGIQFNYYGYRIPGYGNKASVNFEAGAIIHLTEKINAGVHVYNPAGGKLGKTGDEKLASAYSFGAAYDASTGFYAGTEIIKEEDKPVNVIAGIQYQFKKQFFVRAGFVSETGSGYGGAGLSWKNFRVDVSGSYHPQLGFSPGLLLIVNIKGRS